MYLAEYPRPGTSTCPVCGGTRTLYNESSTADYWYCPTCHTIYDETKKGK